MVASVAPTERARRAAASKKDVHVSNKWVDWRHGDKHQRRLISKVLSGFDQLCRTVALA